MARKIDLLKITVWAGIAVFSAAFWAILLYVLLA